MKMDRSGLAYLHDVLMTGLAFVAAFYLRVGNELFGFHYDGLVQGLPVVMLTGAITYRLFGLYRGIWRYASTPDLIKVTKAATTVSVVSVLLLFMLTRLDTIPRSIPVIQWFVLLILLGGPRFAYRLFKDRRLSLSEFSGGADIRVPVLLVGAGDGADQLIRALSLAPQAAYRVVGVVDDKGGRRVGRAIRGVPVLGDIDSLPMVVESLHARGIKPQRLVITKRESEANRDLIRRLLDLAEPLGLSLSRLPSLTEFKDALGEGKIELRPVAVEDLLGRPQTVLNRDAISGLVAGRRVLVTGAGGTIGSELTRQIAALGPAELTMLDAGEFNLYTIDGEIRGRYPELPCHSVIADVRDRARILALFQRTRPDLVFHAAALKHVPLVESNPEEGVLTNAIGTRNVADAASKAGSRAMVLISTDKAINPSSVMGATKRVAEAYCQSLDLAPASEGAEHPLHDGTLRQCAGIERLGRPAVPAPACGGRAADRHPPRHAPLFHDRARSGGTGAPGIGLWRRPSQRPRPDLRPRHGRTGQDRRSGAQHDPADGIAPGQGHPNRVHRPSPRREAVRGTSVRRRGPDPDRGRRRVPGIPPRDRPRSDQPCPGRTGTGRPRR